MDRRKVGRVLVLIGAVLLLVESVRLCVEYVIPTLQEVLGDVRIWGVNEVLSGESDHIRAYRLLGNALIDIYLLCVAILAFLSLRRGRPLGPLVAHLLGLALFCVRAYSLTTVGGCLVALGTAALLAGTALLAGWCPRGGSVLGRYGRAAGDVATLGLAFMSGAYLYTACCVVANEFYASMMAELAGQVGHVVDRGWVALRLAHFVAASVVSLLVALERPGPGGEAGRGRVVLRAAGYAALVALMLRGIAEHYRYYGFLPRLQQVTICLCVLCLVGAALERVGARLDGEASGAAPEGTDG